MKKWENYALIIKISEIMSQRNLKLGKTVKQELIYILRTLYNSSFGYNYEFYIYGPYSQELSSDLEYLDSINLLNVNFEEHSTYRGYTITIGENVEKVLLKTKDYLDQNVSNIIRVIDNFGDKSARELELKATIIYLIFNEKLYVEHVAKRVKSLKPYFAIEDIDNGVEEIKELVY